MKERNYPTEFNYRCNLCHVFSRVTSAMHTHCKSTKHQRNLVMYMKNKEVIKNMKPVISNLNLPESLN